MKCKNGDLKVYLIDFYDLTFPPPFSHTHPTDTPKGGKMVISVISFYFFFLLIFDNKLPKLHFVSFGKTQWERSGVAVMAHCAWELIKMHRAILLQAFVVGHHTLTHHTHSFHSSFGCKSISIIPLIELSDMFCAPFLSFLFISCHRTGLITVYWILIQLELCMLFILFL